MGGLAHVIGRQDMPLIRVTVPQLLTQAAARFGTREAVVFAEPPVRWTYADLARQADDLAAGLLALGLRKGERIGIWSPNRPEWILTQYATARIGLILVNINPAYRLTELEYALNKVECKALITAAAFKSSDYVGMLAHLAPELAKAEPGKLRAAKLPHLRIVIRTGAETTPGMLNFDQVMALGTPAEHRRLDDISASLDPDEPINIQFTSGTTGQPKGATLTHFNIVNNAHGVVGAMRFSERDRLCVPVPLYHCFGMVMGSLGCVSHGACMVFPGEGFAADTTLAAIAEERCTALYGVPTMFIGMLNQPDFGGFDLSSLRTGVMAGAPCPIEVMRRVISDMHMREVTIAYGMTETSPVSFQSATDDPLEKRVATVGRIHPHVEAKVIDSAGHTAAIGTAGELCTRGYSVMQGYWNDPERTAEAIDSDGWMHTGDLATIDAEGYCNIVGRVKDMVIRGGENVYPREVEEFLFRHPKAQAVQVFGVPDERMGEELCAWIVLKPGQDASEDEIREFCRDQIAHYKIPRYVRFVAELPMTVTGKPQKFKMREAMMAELGLSQAETA
ncbi:MAG TPA: AMP-binding protein [Kiloniellales bacterium]